MNRLKFTLKAWPVIAVATIGLCYLTQAVAKLFDVNLPDQQNIELVRSFAAWSLTFVFLCIQVIVLFPVAEELLFRYLLFKLPAKYPPFAAKRGRVAWATASSLAFSAAHYIAQPFPDAAFIALFFFGLAQCWLYHKTGRIWCAMLNHGLFNLTNMILLFFLPQ